MHARQSKRSAYGKGLAPFAIVLVLIAAYFGLFDPYEVSGENLLPQSDFESETWAREMPPGWRGLGELSRWGATLGYEGSGGLEVRAGSERGGRVEWILDNPTRFAYVRVSGRLRTEDVVAGKRAWNLARLVFFSRDESGRSRWDFPHTVAYLSGTTEWEVFEATLPIPPGVKSGHLVVQQAGSKGRVFVDDLALRPARLKSSVEPTRAVLAFAWVATFALALAVLAPWRERGGILTTLLVLAIVAGVAAPARSFSELVKWQESLTEDLRERVSAWRDKEKAQPEPKPEPVQKPEPAPPRKGTGREPAKPAREPVESVPDPARSATSELPGPDPLHITSAVKEIKKSGHALLFGLLGLSAALSVLWQRSLAMLLPLAGVLALFAASTELLQFMIARRQPTWYDLGVDLLGLAIGLALACVALALFRRKKTGEDPKVSP